MDAAPRPEPMARPVTEVSISRLATTVFSIIAVMLAMAALVTSADGRSEAQATQKGVVDADAVPVALTEFKIEPSSVEVQKGGTLRVTNRGVAAREEHRNEKSR